MKTLNELKQEMEEIMGAWNGKEAGPQEERFKWASEVNDLIDKLKIILEI